MHHTAFDRVARWTLTYGPPTLMLTAALTLGAAPSLAGDVPRSGSATRADETAANPYGDQPIEDNCFLVEEAYNQETGVVQHIAMGVRPTTGRGWDASFTQEWPAPSQRHQLSYTVSGAAVASDDGRHRGAGDSWLNYRYQLTRGRRTWIAPRASLLIPTGDARRGLGTGGWGLQVDLPVSVRATRWLATHTNLGATWVRRAENTAGARADANGVNLGQAFVFLVSERLNLMLEAVWTSSDTVTGAGRTVRERTALVSPGFRFAVDFPSGLQIVPGLAFPTGVGPSRGEHAVLAYLSFEHPF